MVTLWPPPGACTQAPMAGPIQKQHTMVVITNGHALTSWVPAYRHSCYACFIACSYILSYSSGISHQQTVTLWLPALAYRCLCCDPFTAISVTHKWTLAVICSTSILHYRSLRQQEGSFKVSAIRPHSSFHPYGPMSGKSGGFEMHLYPS